MPSRLTPPPHEGSLAHARHGRGVTEVCESAVGETATGEYRAVEDGKGSAFGVTDIGLIVMALIWGINYSAVKTGITALEPFTFNGIRVALAAIVLAAIAA